MLVRRAEDPSCLSTASTAEKLDGSFPRALSSSAVYDVHGFLTERIKRAPPARRFREVVLLALDHAPLLSAAHEVDARIGLAIALERSGLEARALPVEPLPLPSPPLPRPWSRRFSPAPGAAGP
jgi:hypothetical protein